MSRLFKKEIALTISRSVPEKFFATVTDTVVTGLRVVFNIQKNLRSEPNSSTVKVYNLSQASRAELEYKPIQVRLDAGYDGELARILVGDLTWHESTHEGVDWVTTLQVGEGHRSYNHARVNRSFKGGASVRAMLTEAVGAAGMKVPTSIDGVKELAGNVVSGTVLQGPAHREITKILRPHGYEWSVQDGELQILKADQVRADEAILISQDTGMLGSPSYGTPPAKGKRPILKVQKTLDARLLPGRKVKIEARRINGLFKIERVVHTGDTHGDSRSWVSDLEVKQL